MFFRQDRFPISWNTSRRIRVNFVLFGKVSLVHEALFGAPVAQVPGRVWLCLFLVWAFSDANMLQTGNGQLTWKLFFRSRDLLLGVLPLWVTPPLIAPNVEVAYSQKYIHVFTPSLPFISFALIEALFSPFRTCFGCETHSYFSLYNFLNKKRAETIISANKLLTP